MNKHATHIGQIKHIYSFMTVRKRLRDESHIIFRRVTWPAYMLRDENIRALI